MNKFVVVVFPDEAKADAGATALRALHDDGSLTMYGLATVTKSEDGEVSLVEKVGKGLPSAMVGALAGGLVGLLAGPVTAVMGLAGGAWLGTWRDITHLGVGSDFIEEISRELAPGTIAVVADVTEDRVAPLDERMQELDGVVLREWQMEYGEMRLAAEAAARKSEIEHLVAERSSAPEARKELLDLRLEKAERRLDEVAERARRELDALEERSEARLAILQQQIESAGSNARASIEQRMAQIRTDRERRENLLRRVLEIAEQANA